jgi:soluble lytic murein transglycosylase
MRRSTAILAVFLLLAATAVGWVHYHTSRYDLSVSRAAARNHVDFYLVKALIFEESWFRSGIQGPAGEQGLMQITLAAAADYAARKGSRTYSREQLLEPDLNLEIGCWYLRQSLDRYRDCPQPTLFALLRYNAGESRADQWLQKALSKAPPEDMSLEDYYLSFVDFRKTRAYAQRILERSRTRNFWY